MNKYLGQCVVFLFLTSWCVTGHAQICNEQVRETTPESRFKISGDEVTDLRTDLIWQRCSFGQRWDGVTCSGDPYPLTYSWSESLALASDGWRLPNKKELTSIVEMACYDPAINLSVFPNTLSYFYSSSSPYADTSDDSWTVHFYYGYDAKRYEEDRLRYVRLVRISQ